MWRVIFHPYQSILVFGFKEFPFWMGHICSLQQLGVNIFGSQALKDFNEMNSGLSITNLLNCETPFTNIRMIDA